LSCLTISANSPKCFEVSANSPKCFEVSAGVGSGVDYPPFYSFILSDIRYVGGNSGVQSSTGDIYYFFTNGNGNVNIVNGNFVFADLPTDPPMIVVVARQSSTFSRIEVLELDANTSTPSSQFISFEATHSLTEFADINELIAEVESFWNTNMSLEISS